MVYKCKVCGLEEKTKKAMVRHIKEEHMKKVDKLEKHSKGYYIIGGIFGGFATAYILIYVLTYLLARFTDWLFGGYVPAGALNSISFLVAAIYATVFVKVLTYSRDKQSEGLKWFGVGGLGLLPGLFINWIIWRAAEKGKGSRYLVFFIAWFIFTFLAYFIFIAEVSS
ncbi:MAG: hypothetical protein QXG73_02420 [Candidatus Micrarchaeaceae archaeon]